MDTSDPTIMRGSGNVFADLDLPDADVHLLKAELVTRIDAIVRQRGITQTEAARLLGLSQPDVSRLLRGDFREYSLERLFRLLTALGCNIEIVIQRPARPPVEVCASLQPKPADDTAATVGAEHFNRRRFGARLRADTRRQRAVGSRAVPRSGPCLFRDPRCDPGPMSTGSTSSAQRPAAPRASRTVSTR